MKAVAFRNILDMMVTEDTSQEEMSWLKEVAPKNMPNMSVTEDTSRRRYPG